MTARILDFPIQMARPDEVLQDDLHGIFQAKLEAAQLLNKVWEGHYIMSPGNIRAIKNINELCLEVGLTPLNYQPQH